MQVEKRFHGIGVSPGISRGTVFVLRHSDEKPTVRPIAEEEIPAEIARLEEALLKTRQEILNIQSRLEDAIGKKDASIFDAHLLVLDDATLIEEVLASLSSEKKNVDYLYQKATERFAEMLERLDDPYLRERALDLHDVSRRVVMHLQGKETWSMEGVTSPHVLVAHNLTPSDTAQLNRERVLGFATDVGSRTSHTAIMARSLGIPAVVGLHDVTSTLKAGDHVLIDGYAGLLIQYPSDQTLWEYGELEIRKIEVEERLEQLRETVCQTSDGRKISLAANIELASEVDLVQKSGAEGVGLFRTEFLYSHKADLPDEDEQFESYKEVAEKLDPAPVIIRTLDLGGDKFVGSLDLPKEMNPFLGWRAIRFCLDNKEIFKTQLRAILRASAFGNVRMMYPMISGVDEFREANALLEVCRRELRSEGVAFSETMEVGAMIEVPSAALSADIIAREAHFFSIGTNDLIQYSIAVDRVNERIAHLYEPTHPAIIRLLKMVVDAGHAYNRWVGLCGEMAGDVTMTPLLLGLGVDELSVGTASVPRVKRAVQALDLRRCFDLVESVRELESPEAIFDKCREVARAHYPELID
jgi:phosphotransferase system enzyme I (PtsI)